MEKIGQVNLEIKKLSPLLFIMYVNFPKLKKGEIMYADDNYEYGDEFRGAKNNYIYRHRATDTILLINLHTNLKHILFHRKQSRYDTDLEVNIKKIVVK
jgi:hypothetical protein